MINWLYKCILACALLSGCSKRYENSLVLSPQDLRVIEVVGSVKKGLRLDEVENLVGELRNLNLKPGPSHKLADFSNGDKDYFISLNLDKSSTVSSIVTTIWVSNKAGDITFLSLYNGDWIILN